MAIRLTHRSVLVLLTLAALALFPSRSARGQETFALSAVLASGPYYPTDRWLPVRVLAINRSVEAVTGEVEFPFKGQSDQVTFRLPLTVPAKSSLTTIAYIYIPLMGEAPVLTKGKKKSSPIDQPSLCVVDWRDKAGKMLSRCPVLAHTMDDDTETRRDRVVVDRSLVFSILGQVTADSPRLPDAVDDPTLFTTVLQSSRGLRLIMNGMDASDAPRDALGFDSAAVVLLEMAAVDRMDAAQQQALISYLSTGGTVVMAPGAVAVDLSNTWISPYLPVRYVGTRYASGLTVATGDKMQTYPLLEPLDLAEWVADASITGAHVVAGDKYYVHAAYQSVGLGRLVVTSFPLTALDVSKPETRQLWASALPSSPSLRWETSRLAQTQSELLESMVGVKVPPWIVAASVVGAYVLTVLLIQLLARQGMRPMGFAVAILIALLMAGGLIVAALMRDKTVALSMARIDLLDLAGGGVRNEAVSLLGPEGTSFSLGVPSGTGLRQAPSGESKPLDLLISPLRANNAAVYPQRVDRVWQLSSAVPADMSLNVTGTFDDRGLAVSIDNRAGAIQRPVVVGPHGRFHLPELPVGKSEFRVQPSANQSAVKLDEEQLRERILDAAMSRPLGDRTVNVLRREDSIYFAGWMADAPAPLLELPGEQKPAVVRSNALARTRVKIAPSPVGGMVHIPAAFTQLARGDTMAMPFDPARGEWLDAFMSQDFLIGFSFPQEIGKVRTKHVKISLQANLPQQTITLSRGQTDGGKFKANLSGPEIVKWNQLIGAQSVEFDVTDNDVDANGWLWVHVNVESPPVQSRWKIEDFSVDYDGVIDGPPQPVVLPAYVPEPPPDPEQAVPVAPEPPRKQGTKSAAKPAKSTTKPAPKKASQPQ